MGVLLTNRKLLSIHPESVSRSRSKASAYSYAKNRLTMNELRLILPLATTDKFIVQDQAVYYIRAVLSCSVLPATLSLNSANEIPPSNAT